MSEEQANQTAPPAQQLHFPLGLLGFEPLKRFALRRTAPDSPFSWLQSEDDAAVTFLVVSPFEVLPTYAPDVSNEDTAFLKLTEPGEAQLYSIVTLRQTGEASVNFKGPIVVNRTTSVAKQVVPLNAGDFSVRHPLPTAA